MEQPLDKFHCIINFSNRKFIKVDFWVAHTNWEVMWAFVISWRPSLSIFVNYFKNLILWNHMTNFNKNWIILRMYTFKIVSDDPIFQHGCCYYKYIIRVKLTYRNNTGAFVQQISWHLNDSSILMKDMNGCVFLIFAENL